MKRYRLGNRNMGISSGIIACTYESDEVWNISRIFRLYRIKSLHSRYWKCLRCLCFALAVLKVQVCFVFRVACEPIFHLMLHLNLHLCPDQYRTTMSYSTDCASRLFQCSKSRIINCMCVPHHHVIHWRWKKNTPSSPSLDCTPEL